MTEPCLFSRCVHITIAILQKAALCLLKMQPTPFIHWRQGYNLALADAAILLDLLSDAKTMGLGADHPSIMSHYQKKRMIEVLISQVTSQLNRLLSRRKHVIDNSYPLACLVDKTAIKQTSRCGYGRHIVKSTPIQRPFAIFTSAG